VTVTIVKEGKLMVDDNNNNFIKSICINVLLSNKYRTSIPGANSPIKMTIT
jgi:hypothetical protein